MDVATWGCEGDAAAVTIEDGTSAENGFADTRASSWGEEWGECGRGTAWGWGSRDTPPGRWESGIQEGTWFGRGRRVGVGMVGGCVRA